MGITDTEVYEYGTELRQIAAENFPHIKFARLSKLLPTEDCPEAKNLEEYLLHAPKYREILAKRYTPENFDIEYELKNDVNSLMTYLGYTKFLDIDLRYKEGRQGLSNAQIKKMNKEIAKKMIERGAVSSDVLLSKSLLTDDIVDNRASQPRFKLPFQRLYVSQFTPPRALTRSQYLFCPPRKEFVQHHGIAHVLVSNT